MCVCARRARERAHNWMLAILIVPTDFQQYSSSHFLGACISRMMSNMLGKETFFRGLQNVLHFNKFSTIKEEDLFKELTLVAHAGMYACSYVVGAFQKSQIINFL